MADRTVRDVSYAPKLTYAQIESLARKGLDVVVGFTFAPTPRVWFDSENFRVVVDKPSKTVVKDRKRNKDLLDLALIAGLIKAREWIKVEDEPKLASHYESRATSDYVNLGAFHTHCETNLVSKFIKDLYGLGKLR